MTIALTSVAEQPIPNCAVFLQLIKPVKLVNAFGIERNCTLCPPSLCAL